RSLTGSLPLTAAQEREADRRRAIAIGDPQRTMRARFGGRGSWFAAHPNDFVSHQTAANSTRPN
ncbi:MAG TPA: hypothetical protein VKB46_14450, partial [Pyrinomonadaceae bacterium]|nr:hypothetical protein [Pyrinomonadaceae bacterium]